MLLNQSFKNRFKPAKRLREQWKQIGIDASTSTVRRRLRDANLMGRVARKKPMLTRSHMRRSLEFAKKYKHWKEKNWEQVLWTDEAPFSIFGECGKTYVRRRQR